MVSFNKKQICSKYTTKIRADFSGRMQRKSFSEAGLHHHFVTRQDCRNACHKIRDFVNHHHKNDALSVDRIVSELKLEEHCPVIAYKPCEKKDEKYP